MANKEGDISESPAQDGITDSIRREPTSTRQCLEKEWIDLVISTLKLPSVAPRESLPFRQVFTGSHSFTLIAVVAEIYSFSTRGLSVILPFGRTSYCDKDFSLLHLLSFKKLTKVQHFLALLFFFFLPLFWCPFSPLRARQSLNGI